MPDSTRVIGSVVPLFSLVAVLHGACNADGDQVVSRRIGEAAYRADNVSVKVAELTSFSWDRFFIFEPYTPAEEMEKELGFSWWRSHTIEMFDHFSLLVFVRDKKVARFVVHARSQGDLGGCGRRGGYSRHEAVFRFRRDSEGYPRCQPPD